MYAGLFDHAAMMRRHDAAMKIVDRVAPEERALLLFYVVAPTDRILDLEAAEAEEERT